MSFLLLCWAEGATAAEASIQIKDDNPYHVHAPGEPFSVQVSVTNASGGGVRYYWRNAQGERLSDPAPVNAGSTQTITSPAREVGYYGLVFETSTLGLSLPGRRVGEAREYGFVVLPRLSTSQRRLNPASSFGIVHADPNDPYLGGWVKTTTWLSGRSSRNRNAADAAGWRGHMDYVRERGLVELPLIADDPWVSDDSKPVPGAQLSLIKNLSKQYFKSDPEVLFWEVGIEENITSEYPKAYYWSNLEAKIKAVREAANEANSGIKLIYQVAGIDTESVDRFLSSEAAKVYDILSLHPYAWPDFPSPETWLEDYVNTIRQHMAENGVANMPIWFTEVGAPHQGNYPGGFFGYPSDGNQVGGLSRLGEAVYMSKIYALALPIGINKIFWYNYQDWGDRREYAEDHFGIRDYWGFPKPAYAAFYNLRMWLDNKSPGETRQLPGNVWVSEFKGAQEDVLVVWVYTENRNKVRSEVAWSALRPGLSKAGITQIANVVGTPVSAESEGLFVTDEPVFVVVSHAGQQTIAFPE
ncbi:hypothetical protein GCM10028792_16120 [Salinisphaera aquimarina]